MTGREIRELLQTIYCFFDYETGYKLFHVASWDFKEEYDRLFSRYKEDIYDFICALDGRNLELLFTWAKSTNAQKLKVIEREMESL